MVCSSCNKESNNRRVCPYCFTPYPADAQSGRASVSTPRVTGSVRVVAAPAESLRTSLSDASDSLGAFVSRQSPIVRWSGLGIIVMSLVWAFSGGGETRVTAPLGEVPANIITAPMTRDEALALIRQTREHALVEFQADEVFVSYSATTFPSQIEGQLALVQQFTRADELVEGRKRRIFFYDPTGRVFARSDGVKGVALVQ